MARESKSSDDVARREDDDDAQEHDASPQASSNKMPLIPLLKIKNYVPRQNRSSHERLKSTKLELVNSLDRVEQEQAPNSPTCKFSLLCIKPPMCLHRLLTFRLNSNY